jgi:Ca2+-binding EF-hand superfamily protein
MVDCFGNAVVVVPPSCKQELAVGPEHLRVESDDGSEWEVPLKEEVEMLFKYLMDHSHKKSWIARRNPPCRIGTNETGVYIHADHRKRFWGLLRSVVSTKLRVERPEAVPLFQAEGSGRKTTEGLLNALHEGVEHVTDVLRNQILLATFKTADQNKNGTLSKQELGILMRRIVHTIKWQEVEAMLQEADTNNDKAINYEEFVTWLPKYAPEKLKAGIMNSLATNKDVIRAVFRIWDANGDGMISAKELRTVLKTALPQFSDRQVNILLGVLDHDEDGCIEYDEFVDFLFKKQ